MPINQADKTERKVIRKERGWIGHFILGDRCLFRRNTLLESEDVRIVVSSVGRLVDPSDDRKFREVGYKRFFETMVFHAEYDGRYWDADVTREISFESPWRVDNPNDDDVANDQHDKVVEEIEDGIKRGLFNK
jgi:hypothetical protein